MTEAERNQKIKNLEEISQQAYQKLEASLGNRYFCREVKIIENLQTLITAEKGFPDEEKYHDLYRKITFDTLCAERDFDFIMSDFNRLNRDNLAMVEVLCVEMNEQTPFEDRYLRFQEATEIDRVLLFGISSAFQWLWYYSIGKGREEKNAFVQFSRAKKVFDHYMNYDFGVEHEASIAAEILFAAKDESGLLMDQKYFCSKIGRCLQYIDRDEKREAFARALSISGCIEAERKVLSTIKNPSKAAVDRMLLLTEYLLNIESE